MEKLKHPVYKNENIETKYLNNTRRNRFLKVRNSRLEQENDFIGLKDTELKDRVKNQKMNRRTIFETNSNFCVYR